VILCSNDFHVLSSILFSSDQMNTFWKNATSWNAASDDSFEERW
jgi:hypothetical protein